MSGAGRRSGYRKSVTTSYENDYPTPSLERQEYIGKVRGNRGTNIFEFELANGSVELARMPNKFKKVIWVKRNDYIIVQSLMMASIPATTVFSSIIEGSKVEQSDICVSSEDEAKVKYEIIHILNKQQIKHIKVVNIYISLLFGSPIISFLVLYFRKITYGLWSLLNTQLQAMCLLQDMTMTILCQSINQTSMMKMKK